MAAADWAQLCLQGEGSRFRLLTQTQHSVKAVVQSRLLPQPW